MSINNEFPAIAVLSVESDKVSFTAFSSVDGQEIATSIVRFPLIVGQPKETPSAMDQSQDCSLEDFDLLALINPSQDGVQEDFDPLSPIPLLPGQVEQDPDRIWDAVESVVMDTKKMMFQDDVPFTNIESVAVVNEMGTLLAWHAINGKPLYNAIHWTDVRMKYGNGERDGGDISGGSAAGNGAGTGAAVEWLIKRLSGVMYAQDHVRFGTLDTWLLWKLTDGQTYSTDVTNASCTGLLEVSTLEWDYCACRSRGLLAHSWPSIRSSNKPSTVVMMGGLLGLTVHIVMTRPGATLYGHGCVRRGQAAVTLANCVMAIGSYDDRGRGPPRPGPGSPLPVVAYVEPNPKDRARPKVVYGLLTMSEATSVFCWLKNNMALVSSVAECMTAYSSARPAGTQAFMVPALHGLPFAPYGRFDAGMVVCGITEQMGREHLIVAAVDGVCYNTVDMVECIAASSNVKCMDTVFVDGMYSRYGDMMQQLANVSGVPVVTNQEDMAIQGAAQMSANMIHGHHVKRGQQTVNYVPTSTIKQRTESKNMWNKAVIRSYGWINVPGQRLNDDGFVSNQTWSSSSYLWYKLALWYRWLTNVFRNTEVTC